jgi:hypothetical protein
MTTAIAANAPLFRIDKFVVPAASLPEFLRRIRRTHDILDTLPGCLRNLILTQCGGPGEFNVVTLAEWADHVAVTNAASAIERQFQEERFDRKAFIERLGVRADLALYQPIPVAELA